MRQRRSRIPQTNRAAAEHFLNQVRDRPAEATCRFRRAMRTGGAASGHGDQRDAGGVGHVAEGSAGTRGRDRVACPDRDLPLERHIDIGRTAGARIGERRAHQVDIGARRNTYTAPAPAITSITPTSGPTAGGTSVTINGTNFTGATRVGFGGLAATSYTVNSDTKITPRSPPPHPPKPARTTSPSPHPAAPAQPSRPRSIPTRADCRRSLGRHSPVAVDRPAGLDEQTARSVRRGDRDGTVERTSGSDREERPGRAGHPRVELAVRHGRAP